MQKFGADKILTEIIGKLNLPKIPRYSYLFLDEWQT